MAVWRGRVASATRGRRGQAFFRALLAALDAMPEKSLIVNELELPDGQVCAIGALGKARGVDMSKIDPECPEQVAPAFDVAECLAQEVVYMNDEYGHYAETPEARWVRMRRWVAEQIRVTPEECNAVELPDAREANP
ncbi:MAG: hypothetical protein KGL39_15425 [Patescibacteria group bacterium]|nr:hypothetical protein [Patescibacteria group bacterium]